MQSQIKLKINLFQKKYNKLYGKISEIKNFIIYKY